MLFLEMLQCHLLNLGRRAWSLYMAEVFDLVDDSVSLRRVCEADFSLKGMESTFALDPQLQALRS